MSNPTYSKVPAETQGADALAQLALDLNWSWNHSADEIWRRLDPELWELTANPWFILHAVSQQRLDSISDPAFRTRVEELLGQMKARNSSAAWFQTAYPHSPLRAVAYFSMEYMLAEALPIYSGGLGNVAGDQLKTASDLGVPVIGIGLLYQQGYFRQDIDAHGNQLALYPFNEPGQLPIRPVRTPDGEWLRLSVAMPGSTVWIRTWEVQVGRAKLYLLDTNDPTNLPHNRGIASQLYGGGPELRLRQEILLGIGGCLLLRALEIKPEVFHLNEGHAAFAVLERAHNYMEACSGSFHDALAITRAGNLFTTHTAVDAGFDRFAPQLIRQYLSLYAQEALQISIDDLLALGRKNPKDDSEPFNMAYLAIRGSASVNGVSRLHEQVSRRLFQPLFPRFPESEVPVGHVTNGVHVPTWDSAGADRLWTDACGKGTWRGDLENTGAACRCVDDTRFWAMRTAGRRSLIEYTRHRSRRQEACHGALPVQVGQAEPVFDCDTLTLGFARRFATYKRPNLLLYDPDRLIRILTNPERPAQLVIAGKAHPEDHAGQALIHQWISFARRPDTRSRVVFLNDYDMLLAERVVEGVDVWINTPRRPWEASGTSGMKVLVNGGLNVSELDGWWAEAYSPEVGWAIGDGNEHGDDPAWDRADAEALYTLLETEIVPEFYSRDEHGIPRKWVARIRESMARLTPEFSANRTIRQYTEEHYLPAVAAYTARAANNGALGAELARWKEDIERHWDKVRFGDLKVFAQEEQILFEVELYLGELPPAAVRVELYADPQDGGAPFKQEMHRKEPLAGDPVRAAYSIRIPATRPASDFTPRVLPRHSLSVPLEIDRILWQKQ